MDAIATEPQFVDHLAPVWRALPESTRGAFLTDATLVKHARSRGVEAEAVPAEFGIAGSRPSLLPPTRAPQGRKALVASYGDTKLGRRLGYGDFAFLEHGIAQTYRGARGPQTDNGSYTGGKDRDDTSLFLVPNERAADLWRQAYSTASAATIGSPHLDDLPSRVPGGDEPTLCLSFHWPAHRIAPEAGTAYGHFEGRLAALAERYKVIGHAHPKADWPALMRQKFRRAGIEFVGDFHEVCRRADLYICDNSSSMYEFAATGRPVLVLNSPMYRRNVEHGLRFWEAARVGINCDRPEDLVALAGKALEDDADARRDREAALDVVYYSRTGGAERGAAALVQWASEAVADAA